MSNNIYALAYSCNVVGSCDLSCSYEITGCEVVWAIRDDSISSTFFDVGAATFFLPHLEEQDVSPSGVGDGESIKKPLKRSKYTVDTSGNDNKNVGNLWSIIL